MLQGSFDTFDFPEVLAMLSRKRQTGKLRTHSGPSVVEIYLSDGSLSHAESSDHGIPVRVAETRARLEEACFEVLRWDHGSFEFHPNAVPIASRNLDAAVDAVIGGARRRVEEWERVQQVIPSLEIQPRLVAELDRDEVTVSKAAWRILVALDGRRNGVALARSLGLSHFEMSFALAELVSQGLVAVNTRPKVAIAPPAGRTPGLSKVRLPRIASDGSHPPPSGETASSTDEGSGEPAKEERRGAETAALSAISRLGGRFKVRPANG
jgi:hypothetical protein